MAGAIHRGAEPPIQGGPDGPPAAVRGAPDNAAPSINRAAITISIMLATIMQAIDTTIANVALPHIQGSLSAAQDQITWILTSYIVAAAIMTPLTGWLAGGFGIKGVFLISVAGFTLASALCGMAQSLPQMVLFRLLQGICGAALMPLSQAVLLRINPPERHGQAMAIWGTGAMLGPIAGPALGGWLTDNYNWRWVFYINLPIGIVAFLGILVFIHEARQTRPEHFDFFGFAALGVALGALQMLLDRGELKDWFELDRDLDHGDGRLPRSLFIHRSYGYDERAVVPRSRPNAGPQFRRRSRAHVLRGRDHVRDSGADADHAAAIDELSGRDRRSSHSAAGHRYDGRHVSGWPHHRVGRHPSANP